MKTSELNSAECYESSETADRNNQVIADNLDRVIQELTRATNQLLAARIMIQREQFPISIWHDIDHLREMAAGIRITCGQVREEAVRECTQICPGEYVRP